MQGIRVDSLSIHSDNVNSDNNDQFWVVHDSCDYELCFERVNKFFPLCHHDRSDKNLVSRCCHGDKSKVSTSSHETAILLGDSHAHKLTSTMKGHHP